MGLPTAYQRGGGNAVASYSYTDLAEGTGITKFYGSTQNTSGGTTYFLTTQTPTPYIRYTSGALLGAAGKVHDLDFDLPAFNLPKTIKGNALVFLDMTTTNVGGSGWVVYSIVRLRKWDGATETEIVQDETPQILQAIKKRFVVPLAVPQTHFKKGETLRLTVEMWQNPSATGCGLICHDPTDADNDIFIKGTAASAVQSTTLEAWIPFVLDL